MLYANATTERSGLAERPAGAGVPAPRPEHEPAAVPVLGKTLLFRGELSAEEDVILQGRVEGSIRHARNLVIGTDGSVLGDVYASHLTVEGLVEGDLHCSEAVLVRATAQVRGNIFAPRVGIMEGALFNGRVEMDPVGAGGELRQGARPAPTRTAPQGAGSTVPAGGALEPPPGATNAKK